LKKEEWPNTTFWADGNKHAAKTPGSALRDGAAASLVRLRPESDRKRDWKSAFCCCGAVLLRTKPVDNIFAGPIVSWKEMFWGR
jgi:hypothetical protein